MHRRTKVGLLVTGVVGVALATTGFAIASDDDDANDTPITGTDLEQAEKAALAVTGEGRVTGTEVDNSGSPYEVEVTLPDGSQVDVELDENFEVVSSEADSEDDQGEKKDD